MKPAALILPIFAIGLSLASPSGAQTATKPAPVETVTVTGQKLSPDQVIHNFITSYAGQTTLLGKIARWKDGLCPKVLGLQPAAVTFIEKRVRDVSSQVGAKADCPGNVEIVFTPQPQNLLNEIRKKAPSLLGFHWGSPSMADRLAIVSHPVQAWYATQTEDNDGVVRLDETHDECIARTGSSSKCASAYGANLVAASGFNSADGLKSQFFNVLIVADVGKIGSHSVGALADYAAMLALSQTKAFDSCKDLPSISNLMAQGCDASVMANALTDTDLAYLRALYKIQPDSPKGNQESDIAAQMGKGPAKK